MNKKKISHTDSHGKSHCLSHSLAVEKVDMKLTNPHPHKLSMNRIAPEVYFSI